MSDTRPEEVVRWHEAEAMRAERDEESAVLDRCPQATDQYARRAALHRSYAEAIGKLIEENAKLRSVLAPFAGVADAPTPVSWPFFAGVVWEDVDDTAVIIVHHPSAVPITQGHFRAARRALSGGTAE